MSLDTVLLVAGVVLIGLEIVVPGGILGAIGLLSLTAGFFFFLGGGWDAKQKNSEGYTGAADYSGYLGKKGKVIAPLRPAGTALIDGERVDVVSFGDYIDKDSEIEVVKIEGSKLLVKKYE